MQNIPEPSDSDEDEDILDLNIPSDLLDIIEDPNEDEEYKCPFDSPNDLMDIFTSLEEKNLSLIDAKQTGEEAIEVLRAQFDEIQLKTEAKVASLEAQKQKLAENIKQAHQEKTFLERKTRDGSKRISDGALEKIKKLVKDIVDSFEKAQSGNDQETLPQLHLIEGQIEAYIDLDRKIKDLNPIDSAFQPSGTTTAAATQAESKIDNFDYRKYYAAMTKEVRDEIRTNATQQRIADEAAAKLQGMKDKQARKDKTIALAGRRQMKQLAKPGVKKVKTVAVVKDEEMENLGKYVGEEHVANLEGWR